MTTSEQDPSDAGAADEETARADLYALLAALFYQPPTQALLDSIAASAVTGEGVLECAWRELAQAAASRTADALRAEFDSLFIGVGKPEVMVYGSYYLSGFLMEKPLAVLRADLARLGLERADAMAESEDHIAALCDAMRNLIVSDDPALNAIATQSAFFAAHIQPWSDKFLAALQAHPAAEFYAAVAHMAAAYFEVERQAFGMVQA